MTIDLQAREIEPLRQTFTHVAKYVGEGKPASRYLEATMGAQPTSNFHYRPTWDPAHELFDASRSAVRLKDWYVLKDPRQFYYATWTMTRARQQDATEANYQFVESRRLIERMPEALRARVLEIVVPLRHVAWGANMNNCAVAAYGYGTAFTAPAAFHTMDQLGVAQFITRMGLALGGSQALDSGKQAWLNDANWQPLRRYVEDSLVLQDPFELFVAQNLALDGQLYPLMFERFVDEIVATQGGTAVSMMLSFIPEWHAESNRWIDAVLKTAAAESAHNLATIGAWAQAWSERAHAALMPLAQLALQQDAQPLLQEVNQQLQTRLQKAGVSVA